MSKEITTQTDVIIIGAGLSGLLALKKIIDEDKTKKVELYEALDRVGGRVCTYEKKGYKLDKGASWVGPTQTRMYELLKENNLKTVEQYETGKNLISFRGENNWSEYIFLILLVANLYSLLTQSWGIFFTLLIGSFTAFLLYLKFLCDRKIRVITKFYTGAIPPISIRGLITFGIAQFKLDYHAKRINLEDPYSSPNAKQFDRMTFREWAMREFKGEDSPAYKTLVAGTDTIYGVDLKDISLLHALFYIKSAGNLDLLINTRGGAQQDRIVGGSSQLPLALYEKLKTFISLSSPVQKVDNSNPENIIVTFENGKTRSCKRVIIAVPPQVISKNIQITNIPNEKVKMLKAMQQGQLVKIFCVFKTPFWREKGMTGNVLSPDLQPSLIYDVSNDKNGILLAFLIYPHQKGYRELSDEMRQEYVLSHFGQYYGDKEIREQFLLFSDENFTDEKYFMGCPVGSFSVDGWKNHGKYWKQPLNNIFWASTETSTIWNGYMEGAVRAGERAALEVLKSF